VFRCETELAFPRIDAALQASDIDHVKKVQAGYKCSRSRVLAASTQGRTVVDFIQPLSPPGRGKLPAVLNILNFVAVCPAVPVLRKESWRALPNSAIGAAKHSTRAKLSPR